MSLGRSRRSHVHQILFLFLAERKPPKKVMTKKVGSFSRNRVTPSVAAPGDTNPSDATVVSKTWRGSVGDGRSSNRRPRRGWPGVRDGIFLNFAHINCAFWRTFHTVLHSQLVWCEGAKHWGRELTSEVWAQLFAHPLTLTTATQYKYIYAHRINSTRTIYLSIRLW